MNTVTSKKHIQRDEKSHSSIPVKSCKYLKLIHANLLRVASCNHYCSFPLRLVSYTHFLLTFFLHFGMFTRDHTSSSFNDFHFYSIALSQPVFSFSLNGLFIFKNCNLVIEGHLRPHHKSHVTIFQTIWWTPCSSSFCSFNV